MAQHQLLAIVEKMLLRKAMKKAAPKFGRFNVFQRGMIFMGSLAGMSLVEISHESLKSDGRLSKYSWDSPLECSIGKSHPPSLDKINLKSA